MKTELPPRHAIPSYWTRDRAQLCLHLGENPFPPTPHVIEAVTKASLCSHRYPDTNATALRRELAAYVGHGLGPEQILVGNGSDELIDLAVVTFGELGKAVATFSPSFFVYTFAAQRHGLATRSILRQPDYALPTAQDLPALDDVGVTFIANPNNPTGLLSSRDELLSLLPHLPGIVVVDECYYELSGETLADVVCAYPNLILLRSLSKGFGLAGLRVGYAVASEGLIDRMARSALTFPVNCIAQAAALAALEDRELYHERVRRLVIMREELSEAFRAQGLEVLPSRTNFIMTFWPEGTSPASRLAEQGIWVSDQTKALASSRPALRIAVGSEEENQILLGAVRDLCS